MEKNKNIVLIGFMGCGKSSIGKAVSLKLGYEFLDTDVKIQSNMKMSINDIFKNYGEDYFRGLEKDLCRKMASVCSTVIATGGGIIKSKENIDNLKTNGIFIYIKSSAEKILRNVGDDMSRPLINVENRKEKIEELLEQRVPLYEKYADITVDVSEADILQSAENISCIIKNMEKKHEKSKNN